MKISIIIPTFNESAAIQKTLQSLIEQEGISFQNIEILIADGGSEDDTVEKIINFFDSIDNLAIRIFKSAKGRAVQLNCGANFASGDIFLFLHADSQLSRNALHELSLAAENLKTSYGFFVMDFDEKNVFTEFYSKATELPSILTHYGDSGIFAKRDFFHKIGGFPEIPLMEDVEFLFRSRRICEPTLIQNAKVTTSARRFKKNGYLSQQLLNLTLTSLYIVGAKPDWLKSIYDGWFSDGKT
ncbi:MAG: TIGR04283 family arsenosugar biosynthesis glycosyltransferase [Chloroherpetonaceae bacterium]|nr:TIGR04283 family arsenosugar biosynthesis glycosyltransferase [Chloroherpetonaceae bacterium]